MPDSIRAREQDTVGSERIDVRRRDGADDPLERAIFLNCDNDVIRTWDTFLSARRRGGKCERAAANESNGFDFHKSL